MNFSAFFSTYRVTSFAAAVVLLSGCPDKEEVTATDSGSGGVTDGGTSNASTTSATDGVVTGSTSGDNPTGGGTMGGTEGGLSTSGDPQTSGVPDTTTTAGTTGGVVDPALEAACGMACDKFFECPDLPPTFPDQASCVADCVGSVDGGASQDCIDANVAFNECIATFTCEELINALMTENLGKCMDAQNAVSMACPDMACEGFGSVGGDNVCSVGQSCPNMPMQEYSCDGDTCTCLLDGVSNGTTCPADGFCALDSNAQIQAANDCCGFGL